MSGWRTARYEMALCSHPRACRKTARGSYTRIPGAWQSRRQQQGRHRRRSWESSIMCAGLHTTPRQTSAKRQISGMQRDKQRQRLLVPGGGQRVLLVTVSELILQKQNPCQRQRTDSEHEPRPVVVYPRTHGRHHWKDHIREWAEASTWPKRRTQGSLLQR